MSDQSDIRYVYRFQPTSEIIQWLTCAALPAGVAIYFWTIPLFSIPLFALTLAMGIRILLLQTRVLIARDDGLLVVKQPLLHRFGSYEFIPVTDILHIRYWSEIYVVKGDDYARPETRYTLDLLKRNAERITLLTSDILPIPAKLGTTLAKHLGVNYEEYLA